MERSAATGALLLDAAARALEGGFALAAAVAADREDCAVVAAKASRAGMDPDGG